MAAVGNQICVDMFSIMPRDRRAKAWLEHIVPLGSSQRTSRGGAMTCPLQLRLLRQSQCTSPRYRRQIDSAHSSAPLDLSQASGCKAPISIGPRQTTL